MRNNIVKTTENNQLPTQVVARKRDTTSLVKEVSKNSIDWPQGKPANFWNDKIRVVRTRLFHDNGQESQMIWHMPDYTAFIAFHHEAVDTMNEFIAYIATTWIGINKYHTEFGVLDDNGSFKPCPAPYLPAMETIIPKGAKFIPGTKGKWVAPVDFNRDLTPVDGCHCATDNDFCGDGCINTKGGGVSC